MFNVLLMLVSFLEINRCATSYFGPPFGHGMISPHHGPFIHISPYPKHLPYHPGALHVHPPHYPFVPHLPIFGPQVHPLHPSHFMPLFPSKTTAWKNILPQRVLPIFTAPEMSRPPALLKQMKPAHMINAKKIYLILRNHILQKDRSSMAAGSVSTYSKNVYGYGKRSNIPPTRHYGGYVDIQPTYFRFSYGRPMHNSNYKLSETNNKDKGISHKSGNEIKKFVIGNGPTFDNEWNTWYQLSDNTDRNINPIIDYSNYPISGEKLWTKIDSVKYASPTAKLYGGMTGGDSRTHIGWQTSPFVGTQNSNGMADLNSLESPFARNTDVNSNFGRQEEYLAGMTNKNGKFHVNMMNLQGHALSGNINQSGKSENPQGDLHSTGGLNYNGNNIKQPTGTLYGKVINNNEIGSMVHQNDLHNEVMIEKGNIILPQGIVYKGTRNYKENNMISQVDAYNGVTNNIGESVKTHENVNTGMMNDNRNNLLSQLDLTIYGNSANPQGELNFGMVNNNGIMSQEHLYNGNMNNNGNGISPQGDLYQRNISNNGNNIVSQGDTVNGMVNINANSMTPQGDLYNGLINNNGKPTVSFNKHYWNYGDGTIRQTPTDMHGSRPGGMFGSSKPQMSGITNIDSSRQFSENNYGTKVVNREHAVGNIDLKHYVVNGDQLFNHNYGSEQAQRSNKRFNTNELSREQPTIDGHFNNNNFIDNNIISGTFSRPRLHEIMDVGTSAKFQFNDSVARHAETAVIRKPLRVNSNGNEMNLGGSLIDFTGLPTQHTNKRGQNDMRDVFIEYKMDGFQDKVNGMSVKPPAHIHLTVGEANSISSAQTQGQEMYTGSFQNLPNVGGKGTAQGINANSNKMVFNNVNRGNAQLATDVSSAGTNVNVEIQANPTSSGDVVIIDVANNAEGTPISNPLEALPGTGHLENSSTGQFNDARVITLTTNQYARLEEALQSGQIINAELLNSVLGAGAPNKVYTTHGHAANSAGAPDVTVIDSHRTHELLKSTLVTESKASAAARHSPASNVHTVHAKVPNADQVIIEARVHDGFNGAVSNPVDLINVTISKDVTGLSNTDHGGHHTKTSSSVESIPKSVDHKMQSHLGVHG